MSISTEAQRNTLMHLENSLIMYRVYNAETLETSVKNNTCFTQLTISCRRFIHRTKVAAYEIYSKNAKHSVQHYVMNPLLYLCTIKEKYIGVYNKFITKLCIFKSHKNINKRIFVNFSNTPI